MVFFFTQKLDDNLNSEEHGEKQMYSLEFNFVRYLERDVGI